jgi:hypothetical protein
MSPLKNTSLISKGKITLFGKLFKNRRTPKQHRPQYANIQHLQDHGQKATRKQLNYFQKIVPKFSLHIIMIRVRK